MDSDKDVWKSSLIPTNSYQNNVGNCQLLNLKKRWGPTCLNYKVIVNENWKVFKLYATNVQHGESWISLVGFPSHGDSVDYIAPK